MKRILSTLQKRSSPSLNNAAEYSDDSPEGIVRQGVKAFCETEQNSQGSEFVHLPAIVESAESSPNAASQAAHQIRKYLSDPASTSGLVHYNAVMLMRILIDNPGHTFTCNIDGKFVSTVKDLLRDGRDMGVQHFLRETLDTLESQRPGDPDLAPLLQMWKKEKSKLSRSNSGNTWRLSPLQTSSQQSWPRASPRPAASLPAPDELVARVTEAKTSAKLLLQFVQSTPPAEFRENELIREFCNRCQAASRAIQNYIHATDPAPDEDTLLTLIETNDELSVALSKYQHALLTARKAAGTSGSQSPESSHGATASTTSGVMRPVPAPPVPQRQVPGPSVVPSPLPLQPQSQLQPQNTTIASSPISGSVTGDDTAPGRYEYRSEDFQVQNPFADDYSSTNNTLNTTETHPSPGLYQRPAQQAS